MATSGARLLVAAALLFPAVFSSPIYDDSQRTLAIAESDDAASSITPPLHLQTKQKRKLQGRFLHITDFHPDEFYKPHTSTDEGIACHRKRGAAGTYGAETTDCDSPLSLIDATLDWIRENVKDDIDFVIWTGDTARHDSDEKLPRNTSDVLGTNRLVSQKVIDTFSDNGQLTIPIIPTFGNNDFLPHNIFYPGPNKWLQAYTQIWHRFIPEEQRHSFGFGGWFEVEVIPNKLSVFSLNTMYFFDRNAGVDGCAEPTEPGFKHLEWLSIQLQRVRERGMKAMLIGHVPPARTGSKQNWDETCWQKYTLWLRQYRDVVAGAFYGHMNIDHFLLQDTNEIDLSLLGGNSAARDSIEEDYSVDSKGDYLQELRQSWTDLPGSAAAAADYFGGNEDDDDDDDIHDEGVDESGKKKKKKNKKKKGLKKIGGKYGERYQLSLVSPSIVPNFFPTIRVIEYNISGVEDTLVWADSFDINSEAPTENLELYDEEEDGEQVHLELKRDLEAERKKNKKKKGKKKKPKKPKNPSLIIPPDPAKGSLPGPAYAPQPFSLTGYTQYFANLTYINNDMTDPIDGARWRNGDFSDRDPKHSPPKPREFKFEVEYSTFTDKIYKLHDLTVRSYLRLAYRIGKHEAKKGTGNPVELENDDFEDDEDESDSLELETNDAEEDSGNSEEDSEADSQRKGKKHKKNRKNKKNKKKKGGEKVNKVWRQFLQRAFVSTISKKDLKKLTE